MKPNTEIHFQGVDAHDNGKTIDDNPHAEGTREHNDWYHGWSDAQELEWYSVQ